MRIGDLVGMANGIQTFQSIRDRRAEIQRQIEILESEDAVLARAERHYARLPAHEPILIGAAATQVLDSLVPSVTPTKAPRKPKGIPTMYRMACDILRVSGSAGRPWLDAVEIANAIRERWWPNCEASFVQPQLWRLAKTGKLLKQGSRYALPSRGHEKAPTDQGGASQSNGAAGWTPA